MARHCLSRIYCEREKVTEELMNRCNNDLFSEKEDREIIEFWDKQKEEYLEINPTHTEMFTETDKNQEGQSQYV